MPNYFQIGPVVSDKKIFLIFSLFAPLWPLCAVERNRLNNSERGPPNKHSGEVWLKLAQWYGRRCRLKQLLTTHDDDDDGQKAITKAHLEHVVLR